MVAGDLVAVTEGAPGARAETEAGTVLGVLEEDDGDLLLEEGDEAEAEAEAKPKPDQDGSSSL